MLKNYLITAFKVFKRRKFFTFISLFAISFTLMVLTVGVSFLDSMFGPTPPETRIDRILGIYSIHLTNRAGTATWDGVPGYKFLDRYVRGIPGVEKMSIIVPGGLGNFIHRGEKLEAYGKETDGAFWEIMNFEFIEGSPYTEDDVRKGNRVAVINQSMRTKICGEKSALGQNLEFGIGKRYRVVGVVKDVSFLKQIPFSDVWLPLSVKGRSEVRGTTIHYALLLARSAADVPAIKAEYQARLRSVQLPTEGIGGDTSGIGGTGFNQWTRIQSRAETFFELKTRGLDSGDFDFNWHGQFTKSNGFDLRQVSPGEDNYAETSHPNRSLAMIMAAMVLFMLLPTFNLVNINISRIVERAGEIGVRKAFGASSWTLVGQFIIENVLLTLVGGFLGFLFARVALHMITISEWIPRMEFQLNYRIFLAALALAVFFGLMSGVYPAWKMSRLHPIEALRGAAGGGVR